MAIVEGFSNLHTGSAGIENYANSNWLSGGGGDFNYADGAFTGLAGLPTSITAYSLASWQAFADALLAKTTELATTGIYDNSNGLRVVLVGGNGDDTLISNASLITTIKGNAGNDILTGSTQGSSVDTVVYAGNRADYSISYDQTSLSYTVADLRSGTPDGTDTVKNFEFFQFADVTVQLPTSSGLVANTSAGEATATNLDLSALALADADLGGGNLTLTLTAAHGTFAAADGTGYGSGVSQLLSNSNSTLSLTGTIADLAAYLDVITNIQFTAELGSSGVGADTIAVSVDDNQGSGGIAIGSISVDVNGAPTVALTPVLNSVTENIDTAGGIKVADILVTDDGLGTNTLALGGDNAGDFEIRNGTELFFVGASPDYETLDVHRVSVTASDASLDGSLSSTADFALNIEDVLREPIVGHATDDIMAGSAIADRMFGMDGNDRMSGGRGNDLMRGGEGNDVLVGSSGHDRIFGDGGADRILGGAQNDRLFGGASNDRIYGQQGNDILRGDAGNDLLVGGTGRDIMAGGSGRDRFDFDNLADSRGAARDLISDFQHRFDRIDVSTLDANTTRGGNQRFSFIGDNDFSGRAGELHAIHVGSVIRVEGDVNGDGRADFAIDVDGTNLLTAIDFIL